MLPVRTAIVPAAGLGTRLLPATLVRCKELLPLGLWPALCAVLSEAAAAGIGELIAVLAPSKAELAAFLQPDTWGPLGDAPAVAPLRSLMSSLRIRLEYQDRPLGVLDAIERGLGLLPPDAACAVLYPDLLHLPDQRGLRVLLEAYQACGRSVYGLHDAGRAGARHGPSVRVILAEEGPPIPGLPRRIARIAAPSAPPAPGELRTTFGTIHTPEFTAALDRLARPGPGQPLDDRWLCDVLNALCAAGGLYGVMLPGEVLDLGQPAGYLDAARRFAGGAAHLRGLS